MTKFDSGRASVLKKGALAFLIGSGLIIELRGIADDVHFQLPLLRQSLAADAGFDVSLPVEVADARSLLGSQSPQAAPIALGANLKADPLLKQRLWEGLYPVRLHDADTGRTLWKAPGPDRPGCLEIARSEHVVLTDCP